MQRAVYGEQNAAIDDAATEEGPRPTRMMERSGREKELAVKVDGAATWPTDAWRRWITISVITQQSTRGGVICLSGPSLGQG